jgi:signal transduction histidine kinase
MSAYGAENRALLVAAELVRIQGFRGGVRLGISRSIRNAVTLRFENLDLIEELRETSAAKSRFLASASHDLRQPLHALGFFVDALPEHTAPAGMPVVDNIRRALAAMEDLFNALLDVSRLDADAIELRSIVGRGSRFSVAVPHGRAEDLVAASPAPIQPLLDTDVAGTLVLLIDDELTAREGMQEQMRRWRCVVISAGSGDVEILPGGQQSRADSLPEQGMIIHNE